MSNQPDTRPSETREGQRIAKVMARAGLCSRRDAEQWIAQGRVVVNGETLTSPAYNVADSDEVIVDGQPLRAAERTRLFMFHKPRGLVTTAKDPDGRATIFDALPEDLPRVVAVGRLDINTEGLLLLTNDGGLSRVLELPATGWLRRYRVRAHGEVTQEQLDGLRSGISIDGVDYLGIEARFERQQGSNVWIMMGLREGKNREIKRVLEHMGLSVNRLIRVSFGPFELGDLPEGEVVEVRTRVLRDQLGPKLAKQAGVHFEDAEEAFQTITTAPTRSAAPPARPRGEFKPGGDPREGPPRKRKHVSVLRAEARAEADSPRKRISRSATADRKGREVKVERVSLARPPAPPRREGGERPPRRPAGEIAAPRHRTPREGFIERPPRRDGDTRGRAPREGFGERPARADGARFAPRKSFGERPARDAAPDRAGPRTRAPREGFGERPARADGGKYAPRKSFGERPARDAAADRAGPRTPRAPREAFGERPARADGGKYAPRKSFGERPARDAAADRAGPRTPRAPREAFGERPARADGGKYAPRKSFGERPARDAAADRAGPRTPRAPREGFGERPARADGAKYAPRKSFGERPARDAAPDRAGPRTPRAPREGFGERPARADGAKYAPRKSFGERPARDAADRAGPRTPRAPREGFGERPARADGGKSRGFGERAERPRRAPGEGKPFGSRGGKPSGGKGPPRGGKPKR